MNSCLPLSQIFWGLFDQLLNYIRSCWDLSSDTLTFYNDRLLNMVLESLGGSQVRVLCWFRKGLKNKFHYSKILLLSLLSILYHQSMFLLYTYKKHEPAGRMHNLISITFTPNLLVNCFLDSKQNEKYLVRFT